jgi:cation diffusion facilitator family transporter
MYKRRRIRTGILGIIVNLFLFSIKLFAGLFSNSLAILHDAFNNLTDMGSSLVVLLGIRISNKPPDKHHPHGHGRFEYVSSLLIALIIIFLGFQLLLESIRNIKVETILNPSPLIYGLLVLSIGLKVVMYLVNQRIYKKTDALVHRAAATDSLGDALITTGVLASLIFSSFLPKEVDTILSALIALVIVFSGIRVAKEAIDFLLGSSTAIERLVMIPKHVLTYEKVIGVHLFEVHDYGPDRKIATLHVEIPDSEDLKDTHELIDRIEEDIKRRFGVELIIHVDPISSDRKQTMDVTALLTRILQEIDIDARVENVRIVFGHHVHDVIFDLVGSKAFREDDDMLFKRRISHELPHYKAIYYYKETDDSSV